MTSTACDVKGTVNVDLTKPGFHYGRKVDWRTPCCAKVWRCREEGNSRLFVIGANPGSKTFSLAKHAYIGSDHTAKMENTINFLKGCQVRKAMGNMEYTGRNMLTVIAMLADDVEKRLEQLPEVEEIISKDVKKCEGYGWSWKIICEDPRLSIQHVGKRVRVLNAHLAKEMPQTLPLDQFQLLMSICAASLNIEVMDPIGPVQRRIKNHCRTTRTTKRHMMPSRA
jgi:hypothetical protein